MKLNIGGTERRSGWKILNVLLGEHVDFHDDVRDLSRFEDECCEEIYCSHMLEHLGQGEILPVLNGFYRLLAPGGKLSISVPDMDVLAWLFVNPQFKKSVKFEIMRIMYGGQIDEFDFHHIGLNFDFMYEYLCDAGFVGIERVESLGFFDDRSQSSMVNNIPFSLNLIATK
jgi:predicted SAM-dependent methyltransferase